MNKLALVITVATLAGVVACTTNRSGGAASPAPIARPLPVAHGTIQAIDLNARLVTVKLLFARRVFDVPPGCNIITRRKPEAALTDLRVNDDVAVTYRSDGTHNTALRIAIEGVTPTARAAEQDREHLEKLLTPSPSERGLVP